VEVLPVSELFVLYWNQTCVSAPLGLTDPPNVALLPVTAEGDPVATVGAVGGTGATRLKVALWEAPFSVAVMLAAWVVVMVPTVAAKVVEVLLAGTANDAGTVSAALLRESATVLPPVGAA